MFLVVGKIVIISIIIELYDKGSVLKTIERILLVRAVSVVHTRIQRRERRDSLDDGAWIRRLLAETAEWRDKRLARNRQLGR